MLGFTEHKILTEKFKNFIGSNQESIAQKSMYADEVFALLNKAYSDIGGVRGSGFGSAMEMVQKIPFWKLGFQKDVLKTVILYKDKKGRKAVAIGTDGSKEGKIMLANMLAHDLNTAYKELSDGIWAFSRKYIGDDVLKKFVTHTSKVPGILNKKITLLKDLPKLTSAVISKKDPFYSYYYGREIGGHMHVKIMLGTDGLPIKDKL